MRDKMKTVKGYPRVLLLFALPAAVLLGACDTSELLQVDLPGRVAEEDLVSPRLALSLVNSAIGDFECAWDNYVGASAVHSDEYIQSSGNTNQKRWGLREIDESFANYATGGCGTAYGLFTPMHTARYQAEKNFDWIQSFPDAEVPNKARYLATLRVYGGFPYIAFAEGFCGTPVDGGSETLTSEELLRIAEQRFTDGIRLAEETGQEKLLNMALVGRARARLGLKDFAGVIADAERVPEGFRIDASREASPSRRANVHFELVNSPLPRRHASIAPNFRDLRWKGVKDPRVNAFPRGGVGHNNVTETWQHDKVNSRDTPVRIASHEEAQLFIAEAAALSGDLARARQILNDFHVKAGIPSVTEADIPTHDDVIRHVIEERRRELFVEGGHRLRDHLRWRGTEFQIPFLGEPGSIHPNGLDQYGQPYGKATCYPVPDVELNGTG
jgi:hypothetical protein